MATNLSQATMVRWYCEQLTRKPNFIALFYIVNTSSRKPWKEISIVEVTAGRDAMTV